jgi:hypothetical protein
MLAATRFLFLCAAALVLPAIAVAQPPPPPPLTDLSPPIAPPHLHPGWYHNGALIYENNKPGDNLEGLRIEWENSYVYQYPAQDHLGMPACAQ